MSTSIDETSGKADMAKEQASQVSDAAAQQASAVASTAKDQAGKVVSDARSHAQDLIGATTDQVGTQADEQTQRLAENLKTLSSHFETMASSGEPGSTAHTLVDEASRRSSELSSYLDGHQFGEIVSDLKGFARRRPGAFILGSAVAGLMVGRLGRAVKDAPDGADSSDTKVQARVEPTAPPAYPTADPLGGEL